MRSLLLATALLSASFAAHADVVFSNINTIDCACGNIMAPGGLSFAQAFTPTANYLLTGASAKVAALSLDRSASSPVDFSIYTDAGSVPGTTLLDLGTATVSSLAVYTENVSPSVQIFAGQQYWLVLSLPSTGNFPPVAWQAEGSTAQPFAVRDSPTGSFTATYFPNDLQFSISGNPSSVAATPEPETLMLLLPALVSLPVALSSRPTRSAGTRD